MKYAERALLVLCLAASILVFGYELGFKAGEKHEADKPHYEVGYRWNEETGWYDKLDWVPMRKNY